MPKTTTQAQDLDAAESRILATQREIEALRAEFDKAAGDEELAAQIHAEMEDAQRRLHLHQDRIEAIRRRDYKALDAAAAAARAKARAQAEGLLKDMISTAKEADRLIDHLSQAVALHTSLRGQLITALIDGGLDPDQIHGYLDLRAIGGPFTDRLRPLLQALPWFSIPSGNYANGQSALELTESRAQGLRTQIARAAQREVQS